MIKIPYEEIIAKVKEQSGLPDSEIAAKVQAKLSQLAGLVSKEGAAHIVANELGIKLVEASGKIKSLYPGMRSVSVLGKVQQVFPAKSFPRQDGTSGSVGSFQVADETAGIRVVCWGDQTKVLEQLTLGTVVRVNGGAVRDNRGFIEVHLSEQSKVVLNPPGETVGEVVARSTVGRKPIKDLREGDSGAELLGTIVQVFSPAFYETCAQCGKRIRADATGAFACDQHGAASPDYGYVLNVYLDDGTDTIRCVFFRDQAEMLTSRKREDFVQFRTQPELFEPIKTELLGVIVKLAGRAKTNTFMNRLEFTVTSVHLNPDPQEELNKLNNATVQ